MSIGDRIKQLRGKDSRKDFGEKLGVVQSTVVNYETGRRLPGSDFIAKLCRLYDVTTDWLIFGRLEPRDNDEALVRNEVAFENEDYDEEYVKQEARRRVGKPPTPKENTEAIMQLERMVEAVKGEDMEDLIHFLDTAPLAIEKAISSGKVPEEWFKEVSDGFNVTIDWLKTGQAVAPGDPLISAQKIAWYTQTAASTLESLPAKERAKIKLMELTPTAFEMFWERFRTRTPAVRGWVQLEIINRFPEFVEWFYIHQGEYDELVKLKEEEEAAAAAAAEVELQRAESA